MLLSTPPSSFSICDICSRSEEILREGTRAVITVIISALSAKIAKAARRETDGEKATRKLVK